MDQQSTQKTIGESSSYKYIGKKEKASYGFAAIGSFMMSGVVSSYLNVFLSDILIVPLEFTTALMFFARFWDMVNDPIMGVVIDRTHTKNGKMRPFVRFGAFLIFIVSIIMFLPLTEMPLVARCVFAAIGYLLFDFSYTVVDVPAMGLMSVATPNPKERSSLLSFYVALGSIGTVLPIGLVSIYQRIVPETWLYFAIAATAGLVVFVGYLLLYKNSKERFATHTEKTPVKEMFRAAVKNKPMLLTLLTSMLASPRYLLMLAASYISIYVVKIPGWESGDVLILLYLVVGSGMFAGILLTPVVYKRIGFKKTSLLFGTLSAVFLTIAFFVGRVNYFAAFPFMTIGGLGIGAYNVLPYPMVGDSLDYLEWKTGHRMEGVCFSLNSMVTKFNNAIAAVAVSALLIVFQFQQPEVPGVPLEQSQYTLDGMFSLVTLIPAVGFALSLIPMALNTYNGARKKQILDELEIKRAQRRTDGGIVIEEQGYDVAETEESAEIEEVPKPRKTIEIDCEFKKFEVEGPLRVGVISDSQLSPFAWRNETTYELNLRRAFEVLKEYGVQMILFPGDICNIAAKRAYARFNDALERAYGNDKPIVQLIMGNHDYYPPFFPQKKRELFTACTGKRPYSHYVVNGWHFIGVSPQNSSQQNGYDCVAEWLRDQIDSANRDGDKKPVFVMTHNSAANTVYGSLSEGKLYSDAKLGKLLSDYDNVVNLAGHLHFPMMDERDIHQRNYTTIGTQSVSYVEMEKGKVNGSVPPQAHIAPMGLVMEFGDQGIDIKRVNMLTGEEEKADMRWHLPLRLDKNAFEYTSARFGKSKPVMPAEKGRCAIIHGSTYLVFERGKDDDLIQSYKIVYDDGKVQYYFSDYYKGVNHRSKYMRLKVYEKSTGIYDVEVYAINSSGLVSDNCTLIPNVKVLYYNKYPLIFAPDMNFTWLKKQISKF